MIIRLMLEIAKIFGKLYSYFYMKHVKLLRNKQIKEGLK